MQFPILRTGAIAQYPVAQTLRYATKVLRFLDNSEQRFPEQASGLRSWRLHLELLDDGELGALEDFVLSVGGTEQQFVFRDPFSGELVQRCRFLGASAAGLLTGFQRGRTAIEIIEEAE